MNYLKFYSGGIIKKLQAGGPFEDEDLNNEYNFLLQGGYSPEQAVSQIKRDATLDVFNLEENKNEYQSANPFLKDGTDSTGRTQQQQYQALKGDELLIGTQSQTNKVFANAATAVAGSIAGSLGGQSAANSVNAVSTIAQNPALAGTKAGKWAMGLGTVSAAANIADKALMGDKNFGAQSEAIDSAVHGVSGALMKSGNPYAMCCCAGTLIYTNSSKCKKIEDLNKEDGILGYLNKKCIQQPIEELFPPTYKECVQIETENGNVLRCSIDHPIYYAPEGRAKYFTVGKKKQRRIKEFSFKRADELRIGDFVAEIGEIPFFGTKHVKLAYLIGLLIGDGTYGKRKSPRLFTGDSCTWKYIEDNNLGKLTEIYLPGERYSKEFRIYTCYGINPLLRELGIYGQTKKDKRLPINIHQWDKESCAALISGLFDTDGFVSYDNKQHAEVSFAQSNIELIKELKNLLLKFGVHGTIARHAPKTKYIKGRKVHSGETFVLNIKTRQSVINFYNNISLNINYKQERLQKVYLSKLNTKARDTSFEFHNIVADKIKSIIKLGYLPVYNLCAGISHTYIANNIVTHNTAGAALEVGNFLTKAGGQTVQGFDVDINSSGYGNMGHKESSSSRDLIGFAGLNAAATQRKLQKRNEEVQMALKASNIADTIKFEQEARMNSVDDVIQQNEIALQGGIDTSVLAAKHGARLERIKKQRKCINPDPEEVIIHEEVIIEQPEEIIIESSVVKAQNGAKLEHIEVSEEQNVIPSGAMHKNKNHIDLDITEKGIPVITVEDDSAETFEDIKEQEDTLIQHAEVEEAEIIFNKELTIFIENLRKQWHEKDKDDDSICLEAGMRLAKEIIENTEDNTDVTEKSMESVDNEDN